jgi:2-keto-3-deoxy-L-rhamnonate aldolase RhmA
MIKRLQKLRKKLAGGEASPGLWIQMCSPMAAEVIADAGFDWVIVDSEHHPFNPETLFHMLLAFRGSDTVPLIRVPWNDTVMIKQVLDIGFGGILTPNTNTAKEVRRAVAACRYPPVGIRGAGWTRPSQYSRDGGEYARDANDSIICAIQIENVIGAEQIEEIIRVPGLDWIMTGPTDMSGTTGVFPNFKHPDVQKTLKRIFKVASEAGVPCGTGMPLSTVEDIEDARALGTCLISMGGDVPLLREAADNSLELFHKTW